MTEEDGLEVVFTLDELREMTAEHARLALAWVREGTDRAMRWACTVEPGAYLYHHSDVARGIAWHRYVVDQARVMLAARDLVLIDDGSGLVVARSDDAIRETPVDIAR